MIDPIYKTGDIINNLTIKSIYRFVKLRKIYYYWCKCNLCNNIFLAKERDIKNNVVTSCGCDKKLIVLNNISKKKYNKLTVIKPDHFDRKSDGTYYLCQCDCGNFTIVSGKSIQNGSCKSCGCIYDDITHTRTKTHGMTNSQFYRIWNHMVDRTTNPNNDNYKYYVERGIIICDEWKSFINFYNDMYEQYKQHVSIYGESQTSIDRIDVNKGYYKENCRFATRKIQANNTRKTKYITLNNNKYPLQELIDNLKDRTLLPGSINGRIYSYNFDPIKAIMFPLDEKSSHNFKTENIEKTRLEYLDEIKHRKIETPIIEINDERKKQIYTDIFAEIKNKKFWST